MMQLHHDYERFIEKDTLIVVIGPDSAANFKEFWDEHNFNFIGIPDEKHTVLQRFGQEVKLLKLGRMPAQMLIDKEGIVKYVHYGCSMKDIPDNEEIFQLIDSL